MQVNKEILTVKNFNQMLLLIAKDIKKVVLIILLISLSSCGALLEYAQEPNPGNPYETYYNDYYTKEHVHNRICGHRQLTQRRN